MYIGLFDYRACEIMFHSAHTTDENNIMVISKYTNNIHVIIIVLVCFQSFCYSGERKMMSYDV